MSRVVPVCMLLLAAQAVFGQEFYFSDTGSFVGIEKANLDETNHTGVVGSALAPARGIAPLALDLVGAKVYFADTTSDDLGLGIHRSNLDGTSIETVIDTASDFGAGEDGMGIVRGLALDFAAGKMYFTDRQSSSLNDSSGRVVRADLDGQNIEVLVGGLNPGGLALDLSARKVYWGENSPSRIRRASLDGADPTTVLSSGVGNPIALALDVAAGRIFWTDTGVDALQRADFDGSGLTSIQLVASPTGLAIDLCASQLYWGDSGLDRIRRGDLDGNGDLSNVVSLNTIGAVPSIGGVALNVCNDGNPCTTDACMGSASCTFSASAGSACDDGDGCTTADACSNAGVCAGSPPDCSAFGGNCSVGVCNPTTEQCESQPAAEGSACDDSDACTTGEVCQAGSCGGGSAVDCSELDGDCTAGVCNPGNGMCEEQPANDGGGCDDGDACTTADSCTAGNCAGTAVDCSSLDDACNSGVCNPADGVCQAQAANEGGACSDDDNCTVNDSCTAGNCGGLAVDCSSLDGDCTVGTCNPGDGQCGAEPANDGSPCDDDDACSTADVCSSGSCSPGGPTDCDDADACTDDSCDSMSGCVNTPIDPVARLNELTMIVMSLNIQNGIVNSLDKKLENAIKALDDMNANNDAAALNKISAFQNEVEAQQGNHISDADADVLIAKSDEILFVLDPANGCL